MRQGLVKLNTLNTGRETIKIKENMTRRLRPGQGHVRQATGQGTDGHESTFSLHKLEPK